MFKDVGAWKRWRAVLERLNSARLMGHMRDTTQTYIYLSLLSICFGLFLCHFGSSVLCFLFTSLSLALFFTASVALSVSASPTLALSLPVSRPLCTAASSASLWV